MALLKKQLTQSDWLLVAANLLPVYGVWALGWPASEVFLVYSLETVIIGIITICKLIISGSAQHNNMFGKWQQGWIGTLFLILFFMLHYGIFVGVQMSIFISVSGIGSGINFSLTDLFLDPTRYLSLNAWLMLSVFTIGYGYKTLLEFVLSGRYKTTPSLVVMMEPYGRIFIQQFTVIIGSMFLVFGGGKIFIAIFTMVKIYFSVYVDYSSLMARKMREAAAQESNSSHS